MTLAVRIGARVRAFLGAGRESATPRDHIAELATEVARFEKALVHLDEDVLPNIGEDHPRRAEVINTHAATLGNLQAAQAALRDARAAEAAERSAPAGHALAKAARRLQGRRELDGVRISIENRKGSRRHWTDHDGRTGSTKMRHPYGYARLSVGMDGDHVDVFLGPLAETGQVEATTVFIITTRKPPAFTEDDEQKCMIGWPSLEAARAAFVQHYSNEPRFIGQIESLRWDDFKAALAATRHGARRIRGRVVEGAGVRKARLVVKARARGEGSRGGHIIGHTRSGKPIYDRFHHAAHATFARDEHLDAADAHRRAISALDRSSMARADRDARARIHEIQRGHHVRAAERASALPTGPVPGAHARVVGGPVRDVDPPADWLRLSADRLHAAARGELKRLVVAGATTAHPELGTIRFSRAAIGESLRKEYKSRDELLLVSRLPRLLSQAQRVATEEPRDPNEARSGIHAYHKLEAMVRVADGRPFLVRFTVREHRDGQHFYVFRRARNTRVTTKSAGLAAYSPGASPMGLRVAPRVAGQTESRFAKPALRGSLRPMRVIIKARSLRPGRADEVPHDEVAGHVAGYGPVLQAAVEQIAKAFPGEIVAGRLQETATLAGRAAQPGGDADAEDVASVRLVLESAADQELAAQRIRRPSP
jgi:hypothetical protein